MRCIRSNHHTIALTHPYSLEYELLLTKQTQLGDQIGYSAKGGAVGSGWGVQWMAGTSGATKWSLTQTTAKRIEMQQGEPHTHHITLGWALLCMKCLALCPSQPSLLKTLPSSIHSPLPWPATSQTHSPNPPAPPPPGPHAEDTFSALNVRFTGRGPMDTPPRSPASGHPTATSSTPGYWQWIAVELCSGGEF